MRILMVLSMLLCSNCATWATAAEVAVPVAKEVGQCTLKCAVDCVKKACKAKLGLGEQCEVQP
jgi:hypothetical protein